MDFYVLGTALFVGGFVVGALVCYIVLAQVYKHKRVKDELLKSKRSAIKAHRTLDRFVKTSLDMFSELDTAHRQYLQFLRETTLRIAPIESGLHGYLEDEMDPMPDFKGREESVAVNAKNIDDKKEEKGESKISSIPAPEVLKNPEIPTEEIAEVKETVAEVKDEEPAKKNEEKEELIKV